MKLIEILTGRKQRKPFLGMIQERSIWHMKRLTDMLESYRKNKVALYDQDASRKEKYTFKEMKDFLIRPAMF